MPETRTEYRLKGDGYTGLAVHLSMSGNNHEPVPASLDDMRALQKKWKDLGWATHIQQRTVTITRTEWEDT